MSLPQFSVKYPVTVAMLMALIAIPGYISFDKPRRPYDQRGKLGTDLLPSIYNPRIVVEVPCCPPVSEALPLLIIFSLTVL
jgi:hypothetical protein